MRKVESCNSFDLRINIPAIIITCRLSSRFKSITTDSTDLRLLRAMSGMSGKLEEGKSKDRSEWMKVGIEDADANSLSNSIDTIVWSSPPPLERGPHTVDYLMLNAKKMRQLRQLELQQLQQRPRKITIDLVKDGNVHIGESKTEKCSKDNSINHNDDGTPKVAVRRSWAHLETFRQLHPEFARLDFANIVRRLVQVSGQSGTQHRILDDESINRGASASTIGGNAIIHDIGCVDKIDIGPDAFIGSFSGGVVYYITPLQELQMKISCRFGGQFRGVPFTIYDWRHDRSLHLGSNDKRVNDRWIDDLKHQLATEIVCSTSATNASFSKIEPPKFNSPMPVYIPPPPYVPASSAPHQGNYHPNRQQQRHNQSHPYSR